MALPLVPAAPLRRSQPLAYAIALTLMSDQIANLVFSVFVGGDRPSRCITVRLIAGHVKHQRAGGISRRRISMQYLPTYTNVQGQEVAVWGLVLGCGGCIFHSEFTSIDPGGDVPLQVGTYPV